MRRAAIAAVAAFMLAATASAWAMWPFEQAASNYPPQAEAAVRSVSTLNLKSWAGDGNAILMRAAFFDPLREGPPAFAVRPPSEYPTSVYDLYILQFTRDLSPEEWSALQGEGVYFFDYVPHHTYLVKALPSALPRLKADPGLRWMGLYAGGYKVDPGLLAPGWTQPVVLSFRVVPGENPFALLERIQRCAPEAAFVTLVGDLASGETLRILVPPERLGDALVRIADEPAVWSVNPWFLPHVMNDNSIWVIQNYDTTDTTTYALSATIWNHGISGTGQTPAVCDTGCDDDMCYFRYSSAPSDVTDSQAPVLPGTGTIDPSKKVIAYYVIPGATAYDGNTTCAAGGWSESEHGTHTTCTLLGHDYNYAFPPANTAQNHGSGMAPNAQLIFQDVGSEVTGCLDGLNTDNNLIYQQAYNAGARIHSNSWGADTAGVYDSDCQLIDRFIYTHEDLQFFFAAGNKGAWGAQTIDSPGGAKNCVTVGATLNGSTGANSIAGYSSRGPTADGRQKPDVCAPGDSVTSASGDASHTSNNCGTKAMGGTSMATPTTAGGGTLMRQYFWDGYYPTGAATATDALKPTAALLKAALINGAVDVSYTTQATMFDGLTPDNNQGYGRVTLDTAAFFSTPSRDTRRLRVWDKPNLTGLTTGQQDEYPLQVASGQPFKVVLAWTDPESSTVAAVNLVNNLDLEVVSPSATIYKGNVFSGGQSAASGTADSLNNVEVFFLTAPAEGTWTLRVKGTAVPGTPLESYSDRQGYALVATYGDCTNTLAAPASLTATSNGSTGIDLSWSSVASAARYQIYRASGDCTTAATEFHYLAQSTGTTFTDTLVQGGFTYAYKVRAVDGCAEGPLSPCATATYTGNCALYPTFAGLTSAVNDTSMANCDILLGWSAGISNCPLGNSVSYNIYRGTDPYFTIGASSRIAQGVAETSYRDSTVSSSTTYYHVVRAEDGTTANGGPANGGNEDVNTVMMNATPTAGTSSPGTWTDAGGDSTLARLILDPPWRVTNQQNHTSGGTYSYHSGPDGQTYPPMICAAATTPTITLQAGAPALTFWERFNLEYQWDGVVVELSDNGGAWTQLAIAPDYPQTFFLTGSPPANACAYASTAKCFTGPGGNAALTAWTSHTADLSAYAGHTVQIRWRLSSDPGTAYDGFYLDDIQITLANVPDSCTLCAPPAAPATPTFSAVACNTLTVNWTAVGGATSYDVYRKAGSVCTGATKVNASPVAGTSYNDSGLTASSPYSYFIVATNSCGSSSNGACASQTTAACAALPMRVPYSVTPMRFDGSIVTWDVANCPSINYHIIYGKGENIGAWTVDGGKCAIGTSGGYVWTGIPDPSTYTSRFLWFLVVGDNGSTTEGSWGLAYPGGAEEGGANSSNQCSCIAKDTSASCGTP